MEVFIGIGSTLGGIIGLLHGIHLYRQQSDPAMHGGSLRRRACGLWYGLWAFGLWTLFGSYVLAFWILGAMARAAVRLPSGRSAA